jgi:hypothetical protein
VREIAALQLQRLLDDREATIRDLRARLVASEEVRRQEAEERPKVQEHDRAF